MVRTVFCTRDHLNLHIYRAACVGQRSALSTLAAADMFRLQNFVNAFKDLDVRPLDHNDNEAHASPSTPASQARTWREG